MIYRVNIVLNMSLLSLTVTDVSTTCVVVTFRVKVDCITSVMVFFLPYLVCQTTVLSKSYSVLSNHLREK